MNNDMANTHGDLLVKSVHKHSSLDHLMRGVELGNLGIPIRGGLACRDPTQRKSTRKSLALATITASFSI